MINKAINPFCGVIGGVRSWQTRQTRLRSLIGDQGHCFDAKVTNWSSIGFTSWLIACQFALEVTNWSLIGHYGHGCKWGTNLFLVGHFLMADWSLTSTEFDKKCIHNGSPRFPLNSQTGRSKLPYLHTVGILNYGKLECNISETLVTHPRQTRRHWCQ